MLCSAVISLCTTAVQLYLDYRRDINSINSTMNQIEAVHLPSIVETVWRLDEKQVQLQIEGIRQLPYVEHVSIKTGDGFSWNVGKRQSKQAVSKEFPLVWRLGVNDRQIGMLSVVANLDQVYEELLDRAAIILASNVLKTFLVAGFMLFLFQRVVIRHLNKIVHFANQVDFESSPDTFSLDRPSQRQDEYDELDDVANAINHMTDTLHSKVQALRESEVLLSQSASLANIGYGVWNANDVKYITVTSSYAQIFGYSKEQFMDEIRCAEDDLNLVHPDDRERYCRYFDGTKLDDSVTDIEYRIIRRDGSVGYVHERNQYIYSDSGSVSQSLVVMQDVSDRKLAEKDLEKSQELFAQAEKIGKLGHWEWDTKRNRMVSCSQQFATIFGLEIEGALSRLLDLENYLLAAHPDDRERVEFTWRNCVAKKIDMDMEYRIVAADGTVRHVQSLATPMLDVQGEMTGLFGTLQDITERKELSEKLVYQASHDSVTGLINRREFEVRLGRLLEDTQQPTTEHALCYLDLDQFKIINDTCGHSAGDELLRQLGQLLMASTRRHDTLARLGGDEFGLLMEGCSLEPALRVAEKIREAVAEFRFVWKEHTFRLGVSIGLVPVAADGETVANALSRADAACYAAKDQGRNRVHIFHVNDTELARRRGEMRWVSRIDQALEDNRFQLCAQAIVPVSAQSERGEMVEVLLRLVDERGEIIGPGVFLPAAERYGLSTKLDCWVVQATFAWLRADASALQRIQRCFINLSGTSLANEEFLAYVEEQLDSHQVPAEKICFEITETAAIANLSRAIRFMEILKRKGCRFALDDFGSGLSSFAYLKTLPVDYLKIDGEFIRDIVDDEVNLALVRSINDVGKVMGKQTIAEFVENEEILNSLRQLGVDYAQGYGIARPVLITEDSVPDIISVQRPN